MSNYRMLTIALPYEVAARLKAFSFSCGYSMSEVVTAVLDEQLDETSPYSFAPYVSEGAAGYVTLSSLRSSCCMTQKEVADQLGVGQTTLSAWELGKNEPGVSMIQGLALAYGVSVEYIVGCCVFTARVHCDE